jgi:hypothetical protein
MTAQQHKGERAHGGKGRSGSASSGLYWVPKLHISPPSSPSHVNERASDSRISSSDRHGSDVAWTKTCRRNDGLSAASRSPHAALLRGRGISQDPGRINLAHSRLFANTLAHLNRPHLMSNLKVRQADPDDVSHKGERAHRGSITCIPAASVLFSTHPRCLRVLRDVAMSFRTPPSNRIILMLRRLDWGRDDCNAVGHGSC